MIRYLKKLSHSERLVIASILIIAIACSLIFSYKKSSQPSISMASPWVKVETVGATNMPFEVTAIGSLVAQNIEITPETAGHVEKILFRDGQSVALGQPLIQLDDAIYKAQSTSADAQLAFSANDYQRKATLSKQGAIAKQALDSALADWKEKKAQAEEAAVTLNKMLLRAPFAGVVGKSNVYPGDYVTIGKALVQLTDIDHLRVEYNLPEKYLPYLKIGQAVKMQSAAYPGQYFNATLAYIAPTVNTATRSITVYAAIDNTQKKLAAGMFVTISQLLGLQKQVLLVSARALMPIMDGEQVYKIVGDKALTTNITVGKRYADKVEILDGLKAGDQIITDGQLKVKNNMAVKIEHKS